MTDSERSAFDTSAAYKRLLLRFAPASLEADYLRQRNKEKTRLVVGTFGIGQLLYFLLLMIDRHRVLALLPDRAIALLVLASLPNGIPLLSIWLPAMRRIQHLTVPVILGLNCLMHVAGILAGPSLGVVLSPLLLTIQLSFMLLLSGVLLRHAIPMALTALALYVMAEWQALADGFPAELAFMLFANFVLGSMACYALERSERIAWLHSRRFLELSERDQLTGLHNRRFLDEQGARLLRQGFRERKPVIALFVDIDFFKTYNDSLGHLSGDEALQDVGGVLGAFARRPLDLVCRAGGEEFVMLLYDIGLEAGAMRAEEVRMAVERLAIVHPKAPLGHVTVSIGVACTNANEVALKSLLDAADQGLYEAKKGGRNRVFSNVAFSEQVAA